MPNVNIPETEKIKLVWTHQEKRRRQPLKKNDGHGTLYRGREERGGLDTTRRRLCRLLPRHECQWLPGSSIYIYTLYTFVGGSKGATL